MVPYRRLQFSTIFKPSNVRKQAANAKDVKLTPIRVDENDPNTTIEAKQTNELGKATPGRHHAVVEKDETWEKERQNHAAGNSVSSYSPCGCLSTARTSSTVLSQSHSPTTPEEGSVFFDTPEENSENAEERSKEQNENV